MALKTDYEKAKKLLDKNVKGIAFYKKNGKAYASIITYERFLKRIKEFMDAGDLKKTMEYGWRDGNETATKLYTNLIITVDGKMGRVGFDAIESYDIRTEDRKYVTPTEKNARFWRDYTFRKTR